MSSKELEKLNFGCGHDYMEGWVNVDHSPQVKRDCDGLTEVGYKYGANSFDFILMKHSFEHVYDQLGLMEQLYALCVDGALVEILCPYYTSADAWGDPDHKRAISENTFSHFDRKAYFPRKDGKPNPITPAHQSQYMPNCDFEPVKLECVMNPPWDAASAAEAEFARKHYMNAVAYFHVVLKAIKPGRLPPV